MEVLEVDELVQAGDVFLVKITCNVCGDVTLCDAKKPHCETCKNKFDDIVFKVPKVGSSKFRCLAGTKRIKAQNMGKRKVRKIFDMQEGLCAYCYKELKGEYHVDHIMPLSVGGTNNINNLCISCPKCNLSVADLVFSNMAQKVQFIQECRKHTK